MKLLNVLEIVRSVDEIQLFLTFVFIRYIYNPLSLLPVVTPETVLVDIILSIGIFLIIRFFPTGKTVAHIPEHKGDLQEIDPEDARTSSTLIFTSTQIMAVKEEKS